MMVLGSIEAGRSSQGEHLKFFQVKECFSVWVDKWACTYSLDWDSLNHESKKKIQLQYFESYAYL